MYCNTNVRLIDQAILRLYAEVWKYKGSHEAQPTPDLLSRAISTKYENMAVTAALAACNSFRIHVYNDELEKIDYTETSNAMISLLMWIKTTDENARLLIQLASSLCEYMGDETPELEPAEDEIPCIEVKPHSHSFPTRALADGSVPPVPELPPQSLKEMKLTEKAMRGAKVRILDGDKYVGRIGYIRSYSGTVTYIQFEGEDGCTAVCTNRCVEVLALSAPSMADGF